ncbi:MAG TPA: hypothetical protein VKW70_10655 [Terriglobia bacterium]|jgi:hypothetical protein|nr:hypothetical protein [Terriglobia bacterium]
MAGINGLTVGFRSGVNQRIAKFTVLVKDTADTSQSQQYATLPTAANAPGVLGVLTEHFVEPNYFAPQGTDPTTVTGAAPALYNLKGRGLTLQVNGIAKVYAAGAVNQGDVLVIADQYGRVNNVSNLSIAAGTKIYPVGIAQNSTQNANDVAEVLLNFQPTTA